MKDLTENSVIKMSSREIAELTSKRHDNVVRDVRKMFEELEIDALSFEGVYEGANGEARKCYNLPKRECLILVSGYSVKLRAAIIDRWQELEDSQSKTLSPAEQLIKTGEALLSLEQKQVEQENLNKVQDGRIAQLEDKAAHTNHIFHFGDYTSIKAYCNVNKIRLTTSLASKIGKVCTKHCKEYGVRMGRLPCPVYGEVNSYPEDVIKQILMENDFS